MERSKSPLQFFSTLNPARTRGVFTYKHDLGYLPATAYFERRQYPRIILFCIYKKNEHLVPTLARQPLVIIFTTYSSQLRRRSMVSISLAPFTTPTGVKTSNRGPVAIRDSSDVYPWSTYLCEIYLLLQTFSTVKKIIT